MVSQCQAGVGNLPSESLDLINWNYVTSPADEGGISIPAIVAPGDADSIEYEVTPVPEPATLVLLGLGMPGGAAVKKKVNKEVYDKAKAG